MKFSKQQIVARFHKIPLTSFGGVIVFQALFQHLKLKTRLKDCFQHLNGSRIFGAHRIVLWLIVHLLLGFRRLRDVDYYRDDPMVLRLLEMERMPNVSTVSRSLSAMDDKAIHALKLVQGLWPGLQGVRVMGSATLGLAYAAATSQGATLWWK